MKAPHFTIPALCLLKSIYYSSPLCPYSHLPVAELLLFVFSITVSYSQLLFPSFPISWQEGWLSAAVGNLSMEARSLCGSQSHGASAAFQQCGSFGRGLCPHRHREVAAGGSGDCGCGPSQVGSGLYSKLNSIKTLPP